MSAGVVVLGVYVATLCPTVFWYDSAEYAAAAIRMGDTHPPGYPVYIPLAHLFAIGFAKFGAEPALGVNFMSALFGALAVATAYALMRQLDTRPMVAWATATSLGLGHTLWANAVVAEVYTAGITWLLVTLVLLVHGLDRGDRRFAMVAALWAGVGMGVHMSIATCGLGFACLVIAIGPTAPDPRATSGRWRELSRRLAWAGAAGLAAVTATAATFLAFALRKFVRLDDARAWSRFWSGASGGLFKNLFADRYDWLVQAERVIDAVTASTGFLGLAAAGAGGVVLVWRRPVVGFAMILVAAGNVWFFFNYRVQDIEVFFLPATTMTVLMAGVAIDRVFTWTTAAAPTVGRWLSVTVLLVPLSLAVSQWQDLDASHRTEAREYAKVLVESVPQGARFVSWNDHREWARYAVLLYVQQAYGRRRDVSVRIRPTDEQIDAWLADGRPLYVFHRTARNDRRLSIRTDQAGLHRVERRKGARGRTKP